LQRDSFGLIKEKRMKKIISLLVFVVTTVTIGAQGSNLSVSDEEAIVPELTKNNRKQGLAQLKAEEDFAKWNKNAENIRWYNDANGFFVYYSINGNKARSFYNKRGNFVYNSIAYTEQFLPLKIRELVKSVYYMDYKITHVNEIRQDDQTTFLVTVTDDKVWKKLRITDEDMEVISEFGIK
jgi:hypothetical protein